MPRYPTTPMCDGALLERFEPTARDSDVFVTTTAKCGQTWLMHLLWHLRTRGHDPEMGGEHVLQHMPWLELPYEVTTRVPYEHEARLAHIETLPDPRVFKLHVTYEQVPRPPGCAAAILTITRDPRDVPYSMFAHLSALREGNRPPWFVEDFDGYFERWLDMGLYFSMVRSYWAHRDDPRFLWLRYEDLKADIHAEAARIVAFLGWDLDEADIARAVPLAHLDHMQRLETRDRTTGPMERAWRPGTRFIREGRIGANRRRLSADQEARVLARARSDFPAELYDHVVVQRDHR